MVQFEQISPMAQQRLLELAFARVVYGFGAMFVVGMPFIAWAYHENAPIVGLVVWTLLYIPLLAVSRRLQERYVRDCQQKRPDVLKRWLPRVQVLSLIYGLGMAVPPLLTHNQVSFDFQLLFLVTIAAIVAGNATHQAGVQKVFMAFFIPAWIIPAVLLLPITFPEHWFYVAPLTIVYIRSMQKHAAHTEQFLLQNVVLQEEGEQLAEQNRLAKLAAEKALADKNQFLTTASHDLRQPVHAMGFLVEAISLRNRDPELRPLLTDLVSSLRSVRMMFNSLLDLTKIESGAVAINKQPVNLQELIIDVRKVFKEEAQHRGVELRTRCTTSLSVLADPLLLRQSLSNLVQNALRYTPSGGILISARVRGARVKLEVWDTGVGVSQIDQGDIFSPFIRKSYAWHFDSEGHGLGLAVVARCAKLMGAEYGLRSREGRGSCFWLELQAATNIQKMPAEEVKISDAKSHAPARRTLTGKCLLVEDDPLVSLALQTMFRTWGIDTRLAANGTQALGLIESGFDPAVILCDQRLRSGESGFEVLQFLLERCPQASSAIITGELNSGPVKEAESLGYLVLKKPLDTDDLFALMDTWLR